MGRPCRVHASASVVALLFLGSLAGCASSSAATAANAANAASPNDRRASLVAATSPATSPTHPSQPAPSALTSPEASTDASFDDGVASIRGRVPEWDNGTGMAIRFVQLQTGKRLTFLYVDRTPPEWKEKLNTWLILSKATWDGEIVSTIAVTLNALKAGRFEGAATKNDCMIGAAIGTDRWDPKDASTAWSNNEGGFCEVELREASQPGHLEGRFKAKLVSGQGVFYTIDQGYLYINR